MSVEVSIPAFLERITLPGLLAPLPQPALNTSQAFLVLVYPINIVLPHQCLVRGGNLETYGIGVATVDGQAGRFGSAIGILVTDLATRAGALIELVSTGHVRGSCRDDDAGVQEVLFHSQKHLLQRALFHPAIVYNVCQSPREILVRQTPREVYRSRHE